MTRRFVVVALYPSHVVLQIRCSTHFTDCFNIQYFLEIFKALKFGMEFYCLVHGFLWFC